MNNTTRLFSKNKADMKNPWVSNEGHSMIQLIVDPLLAAITWIKDFLYLYLYISISLSHRSGEILSHSSLQRCSCLLRFVGICLYD